MALLLGTRGRHGGDLQGDRRGVKVIKNTWRSKISLCRENRNLEYGQFISIFGAVMPKKVPNRSREASNSGTAAAARAPAYHQQSAAPTAILISEHQQQWRRSPTPMLQQTAYRFL
jgi:hypothetical protein